jgi:hypothetical protein
MNLLKFWPDKKDGKEFLRVQSFHLFFSKKENLSGVMGRDGGYSLAGVFLIGS